MFLNEELKKRLLSLAWRAGAAAVVAILAVLLKALPDLGMPEVITGVLILVINEITKFLNSRYEIGNKVIGAFK